MIDVPPPYAARPGSLADIESVWRLMVAINRAESGRPGFSLSEFENWFTDGEVTIEEDLLIVHDAAGNVVAAEFVNQRGPFVRPLVIGGVHPDHMGRGLGWAMMTWAQRHAATGSLAKAPAGARVTLVSISTAGHEPSAKLMRDSGFGFARNFVDMEIEFDGAPPAPAVPAGVLIRQFVAETEVAALAEAVAAGFRDHYGYVEVPLEQRIRRLEHWMSADHHDPALWWVADRSNRIVGYNLCDGAAGGDDTMGYVASLAVLPEFRGEGLGRALLLHGFGEFHRRGKRGASLGVDAESLTGATRLYESVGMVVAAKLATWESEIRPGTELATMEASQ